MESGFAHRSLAGALGGTGTRMTVTARTIRRIIISFILGYLVCWSVGYIDDLPYSPARVYISDALALPGGLIAWVFVPGGVHSEHGAALWGILCVAGNVLFYAGLWFVALTLWHRRRSRPQAHSSGP